MRKLLIISLCLIVLIAGFAVISRHHNMTAPTAKYIFKGGVAGVPSGTASSANYKLIAGTINLVPEK